MLTFDEATHTYEYNGVRVPSVTQIMGALRDFAGISPEVLDFAAQRGTAVHTACTLWDRGDLDEGSIDDRIAPYLEAWKNFTRCVNPEWAVSEKPLYDPVNRYAGSPDRAGFLPAYDCYAVVEIKAVAQLHPAFGVQLAGYKRLLEFNEDFPPDTKRFVVHLRKDGTSCFEEYDNPRDEIVFRSCLTIHNWRMQCLK